MVETWTYLERTGDMERGEINALASTAIGAKRFVTAVRNAAGNLKLFVWEVDAKDGNGSVKLLDTIEGGATSKIAAASLSVYRFVTVECKSGILKLTVWDVDDNGKVAERTTKETNKNDEIFQGEPTVAAFSDNLVVTAVRDDKDRLKLISWKIRADGSYTTELMRMDSAIEEGEQVHKIAVAAYDPYPPNNGCLATAVTVNVAEGGIDQYTKLKIINWRIKVDGRFDRLGDAYGDAAHDVVATTLSHKRIVTATRDFENRLVVQTWDFDAQGDVYLHASASAGEIGGLDVTTLNAARIITAVRDASGNLKLIVWDAIDKIVRLGAANAGGIKLLSVVTLGSDWIATPVAITAGTLKVIVWREHAVSLLRSWWGPPQRAVIGGDGLPRLERMAQPAETFSTDMDDDQDLRPVERPVVFEISDSESSDPGDAEPAGQGPFFANKFFPGIEGVDPMIAVGFKYIVVSQQTRIAFFDKSGNQIHVNGDWTFKINNFFSSFLEGRRQDGSPNEHCINRHTQFPPHGPYLYPPCCVNCDPDAKDPNGKPLPPCIREFYDTRVHFDPVSRRFFIFAPARPWKVVKGLQATAYDDPEGTNTNKEDNLFNRRYWAFAVSKTEDPRDGFYQWMSTEAYIADGPEFTVNNGVMIVSKQPEDLSHQPFGNRPLVFVFSVEDLIEGKPYPRSRKLFPKDFPDYRKGNLIPLTHYGNTAGRTFLVGKNTSKETEINIYSFKNPSNWESVLSIDKTQTEIVSSSGTQVEVTQLNFYPPKFRDGNIYHTMAKRIIKDKFYAIRLFRLPLKSLSTNPTPSTNKSDAYLYQLFPNRAADDHPDDKISYEASTIAVNKDGHMVILFCRAEHETQAPLYPQARYSIFYADNRGLQGSRVLQEGTGPSYPKAIPFNHLDYQTAVVDPSDDKTVWMISEFSDNGTYKTVVAKVKP